MKLHFNENKLTFKITLKGFKDRNKSLHACISVDIKIRQKNSNGFSKNFQRSPFRVNEGFPRQIEVELTVNDAPLKLKLSKNDDVPNEAPVLVMRNNKTVRQHVKDQEVTHLIC